MKKLSKKLCLTLILCMCIFMLAACGSGGSSKSASMDESELYGTWVKVEDDMTTTYTFKSDGTYTELVETSGAYAISMSDEGTYKLKGNELTLTSASFEMDYSYEVSIEGSEMTWDNGRATIVYTKK